MWVPEVLVWVFMFYLKPVSIIKCCITDYKFSVLFAFTVSSFLWVVREFEPGGAEFSASESH